MTQMQNELEKSPAGSCEIAKHNVTEPQSHLLSMQQRP